MSTIEYTLFLGMDTLSKVLILLECYKCFG